MLQRRSLHLGECILRAKGSRKMPPQANLGVSYDLGEGVPQYYAEAARWWRLAAEQGYLPAQTGLAGRYFDGRGVPQDEAEAVRWYRLAAEQGDAEVLRWLHQWEAAHPREP